MGKVTPVSLRRLLVNFSVTFVVNLTLLSGLFEISWAQLFVVTQNLKCIAQESYPQPLLWSEVGIPLDQLQQSSPVPSKRPQCRETSTPLPNSLVPVPPPSVLLDPEQELELFSEV